MDTNIYRARRERLKCVLQDRGIEALLVSHAANRYYLSGFELHDPQCNESTGWLVVSASGEDCLFTDPRYEDAAKRVWDENELYIYNADKFKLVAETLKGKGLSNVAFEPRAMHLFDHDKLAEWLSLRPVDNLVEDLRIIKDADEIRRMEASMDLNHRLFEYIETQLEPRRTEEAISWDIEKFFRENGAEGMAFSSIVGVGPNAALPHAIPGNPNDADADILMVDLKSTSNLIPALLGKQVDCWVGPAPHPAIAEYKGVGHIALNSRDLPPKGEWEDFPCCVMGTSEKLIAEHPEVIQAMTNLMTATADWSNKNKLESAKISAQWIGAPEEALAKSAIIYTTDPSQNWLKGEEMFLEMLRNMNKLKGKLKDTDPETSRKLLFDFTFVDKSLGR